MPASSLVHDFQVEKKMRFFTDTPILDLNGGEKHRHQELLLVPNIYMAFLRPT